MTPSLFNSVDDIKFKNMKDIYFQNHKEELIKESKKGVDFIVAACIIWIIITFVWTLQTVPYSKSVLTFIAGGLLLPIALLLSKVFKTNWKLKHNPLLALGLYLNFAQLFYFPFIIFFLIQEPIYFVMSYAIITAAHLFPYAWLYDHRGYAIIAGIGSVGSFLLAINVSHEHMYFVPMFIASCLLVLAIWIYRNI